MESLVDAASSVKCEFCGGKGGWDEDHGDYGSLYTLYRECRCCSGKGWIDPDLWSFFESLWRQTLDEYLRLKAAYDDAKKQYDARTKEFEEAKKQALAAPEQLQRIHGMSENELRGIKLYERFFRHLVTWEGYAPEPRLWVMVMCLLLNVAVNVAVGRAVFLFTNSTVWGVIAAVCLGGFPCVAPVWLIEKAARLCPSRHTLEKWRRSEVERELNSQAPRWPPSPRQPDRLYVFVHAMELWQKR